MMLVVSFTLTLFKHALYQLFVPLLADYVIPALFNIVIPFLSNKGIVILVETVYSASKSVISPLAGILNNLIDSKMGSSLVQSVFGTSLASSIFNIYSYCVFGAIKCCLRLLIYPKDLSEIFAMYFLTDLAYYEKPAKGEPATQRQAAVEETQVASGSQGVASDDNTIASQLGEESNDYFEKIIVEIMKETNSPSASTAQEAEDKSGFDDWWKMIGEELGVHNNSASFERPPFFGDGYNLSLSTHGAGADNSIVLNVAGTPVPPSAVKIKAPVSFSRPFTGIHRLNVNTLNCSTDRSTSTLKHFPPAIGQAGLRKRKTDENRAPPSSHE